MKKAILLIFGLLTLIACNEDMIPETVDMKQDERLDMISPLTNSAPGFASPYEDTMYGDSIVYTGINNSPFFVEVIPYIGLAYYDGDDDGIYNTVSTSFNLATTTSPGGGYPNLYAGSREYLNLLQGPTLTIVPGAPHFYSGDNHCPVKNGQTFDLTGIGTQDEIDLLADAGKIYYFDVIVRRSGGLIVHQALIKQEFFPQNTPTLLTAFGDWDYLGFIVPTTPFVEPFYFNIPSKEIATGTILTSGAAVDNSFFTSGGTYRITYRTTSSAVMILIQ